MPDEILRAVAIFAVAQITSVLIITMGAYLIIDRATGKNKKEK